MHRRGCSFGKKDLRSEEVKQLVAVRSRKRRKISARGRPSRSTPCKEKVRGIRRVSRKKPVKKGNGLVSKM